MRFFNDALFDMTQAIFRNGGQIYRYVGDEIIMTWPAHDAHRAVQCVRNPDALRERRPYEQRYGRSPDSGTDFTSEASWWENWRPACRDRHAWGRDQHHQAY